MASFKHRSFQDRVASAGKAKQKALKQLKARPAVDESRMAERRQAWEVREQTLADQRSAKSEATAAAKAEKASAKAAALAEAEAAAALKEIRLSRRAQQT